MAFVAKESLDKGKKGGEKSKKAKKGKCFNCKKVGQYASECWAPGGGAEGKGPKQKEKGKEKDVATKVEEKDNNDDGVWMAMIDLEEEIQEVQESTEVKDEMWSTKEISTDYDVCAELMPDVTMSVEGYIIADCDKFYNFLDIRDVDVDVKIDMA